MPISVALIRKLDAVPPELKDIFLTLVEELERNRQETVTKREFNELKQVVKELADAQKRSEERLSRLETVVAELAEAQKRTEQRLNELAEAQKRTEQRLNELAEAQKRTEQRLNELAEAQKRTEEEIRKLTGSLKRTREEVGGLSRTVAYALENEAYRRLPPFLKERHGIDILDRMIRAEIRGEEMNLFARARKDGQEIVLLGEAVLRLDDLSKLRKVKKKVKLASEEFDQEIVPIIVTHFARKKVFEKAREAGFLVVQSFEW